MIFLVLDEICPQGLWSVRDDHRKVAYFLLLGIEVLATNYSDRRKRKLAEAMFIRDLKPTLNKQKESNKLLLFARDVKSSKDDNEKC